MVVAWCKKKKRKKERAEKKQRHIDLTDKTWRTEGIGFVWAGGVVKEVTARQTERLRQTDKNVLLTAKALSGLMVSSKRSVVRKRKTDRHRDVQTDRLTEGQQCSSSLEGINEDCLRFQCGWRLQWDRDHTKKDPLKASTLSGGIA